MSSLCPCAIRYALVILPLYHLHQLSVSLYRMHQLFCPCATCISSLGPCTICISHSALVTPALALCVHCTMCFSYSALVPPALALCVLVPYLNQTACINSMLLFPPSLGTSLPNPGISYLQTLMAYPVQVLLSSCTYKICRGNWNLTHHIPLSAGLDRIHNGRQLVALDIRTGSSNNAATQRC